MPFRCTYFNFRATLPDGFRFGPLRTKDVKKINALWPGRFKNSEGLIENAIKLNLSMGIYNPKDEVIAWIVRYILVHLRVSSLIHDVLNRLDNGCMGIGQTDPRYLGHYYGYLASFHLAEKIEKECNIEAFIQINTKNEKADKTLHRANMELIDTFCWISVKRKAKSPMYPAWGHL